MFAFFSVQPFKISNGRKKRALSAEKLFHCVLINVYTKSLNFFLNINYVNLFNCIGFFWPALRDMLYECMHNFYFAVGWTRILKQPIKTRVYCLLFVAVSNLWSHSVRNILLREFPANRKHTSLLESYRVNYLTNHSLILLQ